MQVSNRLPRRVADVCDQTISAAGDTFVDCNLLGDVQHPAPKRVVSRREFCRRSDVLARKDQHVGRRLRIDVTDRDD